MVAVPSSMAVLQDALGGTELIPRQQGVAQPGVEAWDTRGYSDLESVLRGEFDVPQAVPEWLRHPGIEWDFRTGHRKRPGLPPWDASAPTVSVVEPRTPSFSSTAPPPKWQNTLRGAANVTPQGKTQSRAIDLTPSTAASTQSSPEKTAPVSALSRSGLSASDGVAAASNADSKRPVANCTVGPPGARGRPGAAPPTDLKPGEYEPVRQRVEETEDVKNGASSYREASMHGELFNPKQTHEDQQKAAYQILDACDMVTTLITKATTESNSIEAFNPSFSIPPPWAPQLIIAPDEKRRLPREQIENARLLKYSEEEKRAKAATRDGLKNAIRSCIKGRQKQDFELRKVEQRLVMQARHATTLTALATGGHEEEYSARLFRHQIKHSQYAALAALGTHQICRFKTFTAFKRRMQEVKKLQKQGKYKRRPTAQEVEAKQERLQAIVNSGDNSDDEGGDSDEDDDVQNKVSTFRALQLELEQVRERQKESQRNRRESFHNKLESVGKDGEENVRRSLMENFKDSDARQTHAEQLRQRAMAAMSDDKVAKNFSRLLEFIDNGQASMRKLLASVNRLDKREKLVMEQLQEQVAEECGEAVEDMVKVGVVPKELMQKVRQTEAVPMIGVQEVRAMQRRRDRLKAIQASIQSEIESTAIKKATDAAANKAYAEALRKGKDLERAEAEAAAASAAAREQAAEQTRSASMLLALNLKQPDKDENAVARAEEAAAQAKQAAEEGKAKAEAQRQYAEQKKKELAAMQGELGSNVAGASAGANAAGSAAAEAQKMMDTAASMSDGTKGTVTYKGKPLELPPRAVVTPGRQTGEATGEGPDSAASVQAGHLSPHNELPRKGDAEADRQMVSKLQSLSKQAQDVVGQIAGGLEAAGGKPDEAMTKLLKSVDQLAGAVDTACSGDDSISALSSEVLSNLQAGFDEFSVAGMKAGDMMMQIKDPIKLPEVAEVPEVRAQAGVSRGEARRRDEAAQSEEEARQSQEEEAAVAARRAQQAELESQTQKIYEQSSELELEHQAQRFKVEELQRLIAEMQAAQQAARTEAERQAAADEEAERAQLAAEEACKAEAAAAAVKQEADAQAAREAAREAAKKKEQDALEKLRQKIEQEALEAERLEDLIAALKAELAAKEALAATKRSTNLPEGEPKGLQVPSSSLEVDARAGSATPGSAGPQAGGMPGSSGSEDGGVPGSAGTQPQQLSAELADPFFQGEGSPTPGGSSSATGAFDLSSADGSSATGDNHTADNDSSAGATPSAKAGLRGLFKKAVTKVIDINLEEQDGQDNVEGGSQRAASPEDPPEDLLKEREDVICRELGVTQKVLRKDDKRTGFRLNMQKILKQRRHQLWLRTKVLLSFLSSEEVAGLTKAGVITGMPNQKGDPKNEGESTYESEEKRLNGRLQMLVNLIDFWSKRLEQARLMGDNDEDAANGMDPGNGELNSMANGFDAQGFMNMIGTPSGQFGDQSAGMPFNGAPHEIQQQQQMMFHNCQMMLANALNNGDMQQAQQIQQMITNLAVSMNGPGGPGGPGGATPRNLPGGQGNQLQPNMPGTSGVPGFNGPQGPPPGVMMTMQQMQQAGMMPAPGGHLTPQQIQQIQQMQQMQQAGMTMPAQGGMSMPFQAGPDGMGNQGGMTMPMQYGMMSPQAQQSAQLGMMMPGGPMGMTMPGVAPGAMMPGMTMPGGTMPGMAAGMPGAMMPGVTRGGVGYGRSNGMPGGQSFASDPAWQAAMNQSARRLGSARPSASGDPGGHPDMNFGGFPGDQQAMMAYHAARNGSLRGASLGYNNPFPLGADPLQIGNHAYGSQFAKFDQDRVFHNTNMLHSVHQTGFDGDPLHLTGAGHSDGFKRVRVNKGFYDAAFDPRFNPNPRFDPRFQNQVGLDVGYGDGGVQQMMRDAHLARNKAFHGKALHGMKNPLLEPGPRRLSGNARLDHQMKKNISYHARHFYKRKSNREQQFMMDFGMTGVAGANNGSYRMLNKQPFTMIGGKRVRNMMEGGLSISGVHLDDASNRSATSGFSFGNAATMPVMPGMRNKRDPGGLQVVGAYGQGAFNQGPIHQGVRGSLKRSSLTMALHASPEFDESNLGSIGSLTALSFGGPSAEQVHLADRFVRDILATAHVPVARDGLLSQLCLWLDDQERSAIRSHIWRIFAQPEPVQRLALKALAKGKIGHLSPLRRCKKQKNQAQKLLSSAVIIGRRLYYLIESIRDHHNLDGNTWTGRRGSVLNQDKLVPPFAANEARLSAAGKRASLVGNDMPPQGLRFNRRGSMMAMDPVRQQSDVGDLWETSTQRLSHPRASIGDIKNSSQYSSSNGRDLKGASPGSAGSSRSGGRGHREWSPQDSADKSLDAQLKQVAVGAQKRLAALSRFSQEQVLRSRSDDNLGKIGSDSDSSATNANAGFHAPKRDTRLPRGRQAQSLAKLIDHANSVPNLGAVSDTTQAEGQTPRVSKEEKMQMLMQKFEEHVQNLDDGVQRPYNAAVRRDSKGFPNRGRRRSEPLQSWYIVKPEDEGIDSDKESSLSGAISAKKLWGKRGSIVGDWSDSHGKMWGELSAQVRQEKEAIYRDYWEKQIQRQQDQEVKEVELKAQGDPLPSRTRFKSIANQVRTEKKIQNTLAALIQKPQEPLASDETKDDDSGVQKAPTQADLIAERQRGQSGHEAGAEVQGNVNEVNTSFTMLKALSRFKRGQRETDDEKALAHRRSMAQLNRMRTRKMVAALDDEVMDAKTPRARGLDFIMDLQEEPVLPPAPHPTPAHGRPTITLRDEDLASIGTDLGVARRSKPMVPSLSELKEEEVSEDEPSPINNPPLTEEAVKKSLEEKLNSTGSKWKMKSAVNMVRFSSRLVTVMNEEKARKLASSPEAIPEESEDDGSPQVLQRIGSSPTVDLTFGVDTKKSRESARASGNLARARSLRRRSLQKVNTLAYKWQGLKGRSAVPPSKLMGLGAAAIDAQAKGKSEDKIGIEGLKDMAIVAVNKARNASPHESGDANDSGDARERPVLGGANSMANAFMNRRGSKEKAVAKRGPGFKAMGAKTALDELMEPGPERLKVENHMPRLEAAGLLDVPQSRRESGQLGATQQFSTSAPQSRRGSDVSPKLSPHTSVLKFKSVAAALKERELVQATPEAGAPPDEFSPEPEVSADFTITAVGMSKEKEGKDAEAVSFLTPTGKSKPKVNASPRQVPKRPLKDGAAVEIMVTPFSSMAESASPTSLVSTDTPALVEEEGLEDELSPGATPTDMTGRTIGDTQSAQSIKEVEMSSPSPSAWKHVRSCTSEMFAHEFSEENEAEDEAELAPKKTGILDPYALVGLPIEDIQAQLKAGLMLFNRHPKVQRRPSYTSTVPAGPQADARPKQVRHLAEHSMLSPEGWKKIAHQMAHKSGSRRSTSKLPSLRAAEKADVQSMVEENCNPITAAEVDGVVGDVDVPSKPEPLPTAPPAPSTPKRTVPRLSEAIRDPNAKLDAAMNILNQYLEDFSGGDLNAMLASRPTTRGTAGSRSRPGTGLPPLSENKHATSNGAALDSVEVSKTTKLPAIGKGTEAGRRARSADRKQVEDIEKHIRKRLHRLDEMTGRSRGGNLTAR